jgi:hypothetical protein
MGVGSPLQSNSLAVCAEARCGAIAVIRINPSRGELRVRAERSRVTERSVSKGSRSGVESVIEEQP